MWEESLYDIIPNTYWLLLTVPMGVPVFTCLETDLTMQAQRKQAAEKRKLDGTEESSKGRFKIHSRPDIEQSDEICAIDRWWRSAKGNFYCLRWLGKSTLKILAYFVSNGREVVVSREPVERR